MTGTLPEQDVGNVYLAEVESERAVQIMNRAQALRAQQGLEPAAEDEVLGRRIAADVARGTIEAPRAVATGLVKAGAEFAETVGQIIDPIAQAAEEAFPLGPAPSPDEVGTAMVDFLGGEPESTTGQAVQGITTFAVGFLGGRGAIRLMRGGAPATRVGGLAEAAAAGMIADLTTVDEINGNISSLIQSVPALANPVTEFMAVDPNDPVAINKLKQAAEGLLAGSAVDLLVNSVRLAAAATRALRSSSTSQVERSAAKNLMATAKEQAAPNTKILGNVSAPAFRIDDATRGKAADFLAGKVATAGETRVGNVNLNRIASEEDITEVIRKTSKLFENNVRTVTQTNDATIALARDIGEDPGRMKALIDGEGALTGPEITALRFHLNNSAQRLGELADLAKGGDSAAQYEFLRQFNFHKSLLERTSGAAREAGRALQALQIQGRTEKDFAAAIKDLQDSGMPVKDLAEKFSTVIAQRGAIGAHQFAKMPESIWRRGGEALLEFWVNSLLAGPKTHVVNFTSNAIVNTALTPMERLTSVAVGKVLRQEGVYWSEAGAMAMGMPRGIREGWRLARDAILNEDVGDQFSKLDVPRTRFSDKPISSAALGIEPGTPLAAGADFLGKAVRTPGRALNAADMFWKAFGYRIQLNADSWQRALSEGLEGDDLARRFAELIDNPPPDLRLAAIDTARYNTFTNPLGDAGRNFQQALRNFPPSRLIFPFVRTPVNILKYAIHRSPVAYMTPKFRADIAAGGNRARMAIARMGLGSSAMLAFADLASQGHISGSGPSDPRLRTALRRTGWQPYSVRIGDQWHAYNRLDPVGLTVGIAADLSQIVGQLEDEEVDGILGPVITSVGENMINKTYLSGLANAMEIFNAPSEAYATSRGEQYVNRLLASFVPNLFSQVARGVDPTLRMAETLTENVKRRIPGLSDELPPRLNMWGEPIILPGGFTELLMSPIIRSPVAKDSVIDQEIVAHEIPISMPARKQSFPGMGNETVELTQLQYNRLIELSGSELKDPASGLGAKEMLNAITSGRTTNRQLQRAHESYKRATGGPDGGKSAIIKQTLRVFRTAAKDLLLQEDAELREDVLKKRRRRIELLRSNPQ